MRVSHHYKLIFFANPKTGSSTVRKFLDPYSDTEVASQLRENSQYPHLSAEDTKRRFTELGWDFDSYSRLVCVRNPWAKLVSLYCYRRRKFELPSFERWLDNVAAGDDALPQWPIFGSESLATFIHDANGNLLVNRVLRTEDLDHELLPYLRSIGLPIPPDADLPRYNISGKGDSYQKHYSPASVALVRDLYRYEIDNFGYDFGDPA